MRTITANSPDRLRRFETVKSHSLKMGDAFASFLPLRYFANMDSMESITRSPVPSEIDPSEPFTLDDVYSECQPMTENHVQSESPTDTGTAEVPGKLSSMSVDWERTTDEPERHHDVNVFFSVYVSAITITGEGEGENDRGTFDGLVRLPRRMELRSGGAVDALFAIRKKRGAVFAVFDIAKGLHLFAKPSEILSVAGFLPDSMAMARERLAEFAPPKGPVLQASPVVDDAADQTPPAASFKGLSEISKLSVDWKGTTEEPELHGGKNVFFAVKTNATLSTGVIVTSVLRFPCRVELSAKGCRRLVEVLFVIKNQRGCDLAVFDETKGLHFLAKPIAVVSVLEFLPDRVIMAREQIGKSMQSLKAVKPKRVRTEGAWQGALLTFCECILRENGCTAEQKEKLENLRAGLADVRPTKTAKCTL
jgi:hypothetical protein